MSESRAVTLETSVDTAGARAGFQEIQREAGTMAQAVARASGQADTAIEGIGTSATASARNVEAAERNIANAIQRRIATMRAGASGTASFYENIAQQRGVSTSGLQPLLDQLRELEQAQARANSAVGGATRPLHQVEMSAAATAAALRAVPAQFTDIVTGLQGGQSPMTILFQQGGQLRDMFGSAGGAARALGGYVLGLVTPLSAAAVAAGTLAVAYYQGSEEARAFRASIIESGNAAGTSADMLAVAAKKVSESVGTQGAAAEALSSMVATGRVAAADLEKFSEAAIRGQRALGQSVQDTAATFAELARSPLQSLDRLNEKYHFVTGALYEQVRALQEQGRTYEAGQVAQRAYADAFATAAAKAQSNLGLLESGWVKVKDGAKAAWDAMLNVGREDTLEEKLAKVQKAIAQARKPFDASVGGNAEAKTNLKNNLELEASLQRQIVIRDTAARMDAFREQFNAADLAWAQSKDQYMTREERFAEALAREKQKGLDAGISDIEINKRLLAVRREYSDIAFLGIEREIQAINRRTSLEAIVSQRRQADIAARRAAGDLTEDAALKASANEEIDQIERQIKAKQRQLKLIDAKPRDPGTIAQHDDVNGQIEELKEQRLSRQKQLENDLTAAQRTRAIQSEQLATAGLARAQDELASMVDQTKVQREYNEEIGLSSSEVLRLRASRAENLAVLKDESAAALEAIEPGSRLAQVYRDQAVALRANSAAEREGFVKSRDPWTALSASVKNYADDAMNSGRQIGDVMSGAFRSAEDALVSFVTTGKLSFRDFATSVLADMARIAARRAIAGIAGSILGSAFGGSSSGGSGGGSGGFGYDYGPLAGARASGGPVNAGLSYLVGEKGPEIFTPSASGSITPNHLIGAGGGSPMNISFNTTITNSGSSTQAAGESGANSRAALEALHASFKQWLAGEARQGGQLWKLQQGRG